MYLSRLIINQVGGSSIVRVDKYFLQASMPSLWGILVYKEDTSMVIKKWLSGTSRVDSWFRKWVVSLTWLGRLVTWGLRMWSTKEEIFSVGPPQAEIMGRPGLLALCIFGRR